MRCFICGGGSKLFTRNSRRREEVDYEKKMVSEKSVYRPDGDPGHGDFRFCGDVSVELAGALFVWGPHHRVSAGVGDHHPEQDPVWRISRPFGTRRPLETPDAGTPGTNDTRGTRLSAPID